MSPNSSALLAGKLTAAEARIANLEAELAALRATRTQARSAASPPPSSLIECITDALVALDKDFRYVWVNAEAERLMGIPREQVIGKVLWDIFPFAVGTVIEKECRTALEQQRTVEFENYYTPWDRWFSNKAYPNKEGGLVIYWRDITEKKRASAELRRQALILRQVHDSIISTNLDGIITDWNQAAEQIFGYTAAEAIGSHVSSLYFEEDRPQVAAKVLAPLLNQGRLELEMRNQQKSGCEIFIRLSLSLLRDEGGVPYGMIGVATDITERELAQRALRESEEKYRCLAEAMPQIAYTSSPDGKTQFVNQSWARYSGLSPESCLDFDWLSWIHADDAPSLMNRWMGSVARGEAFQAEYRLKNRHGDYRWQLGSAVPLRAPSGHVLQWVGTVTDIHDRKSVEEALRLSEERFRLAVGAFHGIVYDLDTSTNRVQRLGDIQSLMGVSEEEAEPTLEWWKSRIHPDDLPPIDHLNHLFAGASGTFELEYRVLHTDGRWVHVCDRATLVRGDHGRVRRIVGTMFDISTRKQLELEIKNKNERLAFQAAVINVTTDAVIAIDNDSRVTFFNPAADRIYGLTEALGQPLSNFLTYSWLSPKEEELALAAIASQGTWSGENLHVLNSGASMIVDSSVNVLPSELGGGMVAFIRDASARKAAETELKRSSAQLSRANQDLLHFAYAVSHDLQTPLRNIITFAQLLARDNKAKLDAESSDLVDWIIGAAGRMNTLLLDLVQFAQVAGAETAPLRVVELHRVVSAALQNLRGQLQECQADVTFPELPAVLGEAGQLTELFQNLIGNSLKYRKKDVAPRIAISAARQAEAWHVSVSDNGIGFEPEFAERIFEVFQRLHGEAYPGTGVGLAICRRIVERLHGRIWADAKPGEGAIFTIALQPNL